MHSTPSRRRSAQVGLTAVGALAAAFVASGCSQEEETTAYCVTPDGYEVVDNRNCDDDRGGAFFWYFANPGSRLYGRGDRVTAGGGELVSTLNRETLSKRAGFGSTARGDSGVGRSTSVRTGGGFFSGGG